MVAVPQPALHRAHLALYVRVGSRFETAATNGISHFLEHMIYRGTKGLRTAHDVNHAFEALGGYLNATTHADFGVFSVTLPPESLDEACALFAEVLTEPTFANIDLERGIVLEEILEDLDDAGRMVDPDNLSRAQIYPTHPLGFTITGSHETVESFTRRTLRAHHEKHYTAHTSVLALSGAIETDQAIRLASQHFTKLPRGKAIVAEAPKHDQAKARVKIVESVASQTDLRIGFRAVSERSPERPVMDMMLRIIDDGMSTRLYHRLCDDKGLCYDVGANFDGYEDDGVLDFAAGVHHNRASVVLAEILGLMMDLAEHGPTKEELEKARARNTWDVKAMLDSVDELAGFYAGGLLFERFETPAERLERNLAVTRQEIRDLAAMLTRPERLNVLAVGLPNAPRERAKLKKLVDSWPETARAAR